MTVAGTAPLTFPSECSGRREAGGGSDRAAFPQGHMVRLRPTLPGPSARHFPVVVPVQLPGGCQLGLAPSHPALELEWARPSLSALGSPGK